MSRTSPTRSASAPGCFTRMAGPSISSATPGPTRRPSTTRKWACRRRPTWNSWDHPGRFRCSPSSSSRPPRPPKSSTPTGPWSPFRMAAPRSTPTFSMCTGRTYSPRTSSRSSRSMRRPRRPSSFASAPPWVRPSCSTSSGRCCSPITSSLGSGRIANAATLNITADAGQSSINNFSGGAVSCSGTATRGRATLSNNAGGTVVFQDSAKAGASIDATPAAYLANAGEMDFAASSSAGNANVLNAAGGTLKFYGSATAGSAEIVNHGSLLFQPQMNLLGAGVNQGTSGVTMGHALVSNDGTVSLVGGSAGQAVVTNAAGGTFNFGDNSDAGAMQLTNAAGGAVTSSVSSNLNSAHVTNAGTFTINGIPAAAVITNTGTHSHGNRGLRAGWRALGTPGLQCADGDQPKWRSVGSAHFLPTSIRTHARFGLRRRGHDLSGERWKQRFRRPRASGNPQHPHSGGGREFSGSGFHAGKSRDRHL